MPTTLSIGFPGPMRSGPEVGIDESTTFSVPMTVVRTITANRSMAGVGRGV